MQYQEKDTIRELVSACQLQQAVCFDRASFSMSVAAACVMCKRQLPSNAKQNGDRLNVGSNYICKGNLVLVHVAQKERGAQNQQWQCNA